jgi:6-phospho-beta-glucosidase
MPAKVSKQGTQSIPAEPLPPVCFGLIAQVKAYELYTVEAAVHGNRQAAFQALLSHPLGPEADQIPDVLADMLTTHRQYLPRFWER